MVGSLRARSSLSKSSHRLKAARSRHSSSALRHDKRHRIAASSSPAGLGRDTGGQTGNAELEKGDLTHGSRSTDLSTDEQDDEDADGSEPDAIAPLSDPKASRDDDEMTPVDTKVLQRVEKGSEKDQGAGLIVHGGIPEQKRSQGDEKIQLTQISPNLDATGAGSVSSGSPEPEFDIPDDDDDYREVDAVSQSSVASEASDDSETFEQKEQDEFEIDWEDPATFDYESNTFTTQHRFSISEEDDLGRFDSDIFPSPVSHNIYEQGFESPVPDPSPVCGSVKSMSSSSDRSRSADSCSMTQHPGKSPESPHSSFVCEHDDDDDLTDECEYECGNESNDNHMSPCAITPGTPYIVKKSSKPASAVPPPHRRSFHHLPPRKRYRMPAGKIVASTARESGGPFLRYHWPKGVRLTMIYGNNTGHLRPRRRVRTGPLKQVMSEATPGIANLIRSRLFQEHHCNGAFSPAARGAMSGLYRSSFYSFSSSFALGFGSLPSLDPGSQIQSPQDTNETASDLINFDEAASEVGLIQDSSWRAFQSASSPVTAVEADTQIVRPVTPNEISAYVLSNESIIGDNEVDLRETMQLAYDDGAHEPGSSSTPNLEKRTKIGDKRIVSGAFEGIEEDEPAHKRRRHSLPYDVAT